MSEKLLTEQDQKLLEVYKQANDRCQKELDRLKRKWLDDARTGCYFSGKEFLEVDKLPVFPIKSVFYTDNTEREQVAKELTEAMRTWVLINAGTRHPVMFLIAGDGREITLLATAEETSHGQEALEAAFPGITFGKPVSPVPYFENMNCGGLVTGIPAFSDHEQEQLYSLDVLLRGLRGRKFTILILGKPCTQEDIASLLKDTRQKITDNHDDITASIQKQFGEGSSQTLGVSVAGIFSSMSSSGWSAIIYSRLSGATSGVVPGVNYSVSKQKNWSHANTLEHLNQFAAAYEEALKERETRWKNAEAEGAWQCFTYVFAENSGIFNYAGALFRSCLTSRFDTQEPFRIVQLPPPKSNWLRMISKRPEIQINGARQPLDTYLTSSEFASIMSLPMESHPGIEIRATPRFCVAPPDHSAGSAVEMGHVCDREVETPGIMSLARNDLAAHTLVAGLTGMGKSTTIRHILSQAGLPFLVLEPAKSEYRNMRIDGNPIRVFTAGDEAVLPLRINPFELPPGDSLHSHIDALAAILNAAFPMEGPMAALLEQGLAEAYRNAGWDVVSGTAPADRKIPSMDSFYSALEKIIDKAGLEDAYGANIKGALLARINSLRTGPRGRLFNSENPFDAEELLSRPTVIEMKKVGSDETKAFLAGLLLLRIYKHFEMKGSCDKLSSLLVIEEAHRIFKKTADKGNSLVGNNTSYRAVELFENILAEVRAYGLGIVIAEQMPLRLSDGAVKNTNLKIIHRLGALEDAVAMGGSMGLSEERSAFICRMKPGEALVHCSSLSEPAHIRVTYDPGQTQAVTDRDLQKNADRTQASEHRPPYFYDRLNEIESKDPRGLERLADSFLFSVLMLRNEKKDKWNSAWKTCVEQILQNFRTRLTPELAGHLMHWAVLELLKGKRFIADTAPDLHRKMLRTWDAALKDEWDLNLEKVRDIREMFWSEELTKAVIWPGWIEQERYPTSKRLYQEAKQMAAAIRITAPQVLQKLSLQKRSEEACREVAEVLLLRAVPGIDVRGAMLDDFGFAVMIALLNYIRPAGCTKPEYLARLQKDIREALAQKTGGGK